MQDDDDDDDDNDDPMILNNRAKNHTSERFIVPWTVIFHFGRSQSRGIKVGRNTTAICGVKGYSITKANRGNVDTEKSKREFLSFDNV